MCFSTVFLKKKKAFLLKYKQQNKFLKKNKIFEIKPCFKTSEKKTNLSSLCSDEVIQIITS